MEILISFLDTLRIWISFIEYFDIEFIFNIINTNDINPIIIIKI